MEPTEQQYDRIARWLDGEDLRLEGPELQAAQDIRRQEADWGPMLDAPVPAAAMTAARGRLTRAVARRKHHSLRVGAFVGAILAVAAAIVLAVTVLWMPAPSNGPDVPASVLFAALSTPSDSSAGGDDTGALAERVSALEEEMTSLVYTPAPVDAQNNGSDVQADESWLDDYLNDSTT